MLDSCSPSVFGRMPDEDTEEESCSDDLGDGDDLDISIPPELESERLRGRVEIRGREVELTMQLVERQEAVAARADDAEARQATDVADDDHFGLRGFFTSVGALSSL